MASGWQSLPIDEAGFREAEPSYDEAQSLCDPGCQSQPMIDRNLETGRLTLTRELKPLFIFNLIQHEMTLTLFMWLSYHDTTTLCQHCHLLLETSYAMVWQSGGGHPYL